MIICLTGKSGFLGGILANYLQLNNILYSIGRKDFDIEFNFKDNTNKIVKADLFIHAAGIAHLKSMSQIMSDEIFKFNVVGTQRLLQSIELSNAIPSFFIYISSVSVYGLNNGLNISESTTLSAEDPYGVSKIEAERIIKEWCDEHNVVCTILRLPLVIGANPPGNLGSLINGIKKGIYFNIGRGRAKKSMVLATDVAKFIPKAAEVGGVYNLTDGYHPNFDELSSLIAKQLGKKIIISMPNFVAKLVAKVGDMLGSWVPLNSSKLRKITSTLTFDDSKARAAFGWSPTPVLEGFKIHDDLE